MKLIKKAPAQKSAGPCPTGVAGLDEILCGGLPRNRLYLIQGTPGVGKTTIALQFLMEGIRRGETALYIALSESKTEMDAVAQSHGWDLSRLNLFEFSAMEDYLRGETENTFFHPSEVELNRVTQALLETVQKLKPRRLVFDSLSEFRMLSETPLRYRRQILRLKQFFTGQQCTVLFLDDCSAGEGDLQIESITHGVISLTRATPAYGVARRHLTVQKIRGVAFREGHHDFIIQKGGVTVFPRLVAAEHIDSFKPGTFKSGIAELDTLLGGGLDRGTSNMFMGPPGTGKSTLAIKFGYTAAHHREKVLLFTFDETIATLTGRAKQLGMDLNPLMKDGLVRIEKVDPAEISPGELVHRVCEAVKNDNVRMVVIDSINGYLNAMPEEKFLILQLHELLAFLNQQGIITIMVLAQQGILENMRSAVDLTYLADTVLLLRYFESQGAVKQAISVIKKRSGNHERTIREMAVGKNGVEVGEPLINFHGVLTGVPTMAMNLHEPTLKRK